MRQNEQLTLVETPREAAKNGAELFLPVWRNPNKALLRHALSRKRKRGHRPVAC